MPVAFSLFLDRGACACLTALLPRVQKLAELSPPPSGWERQEMEAARPAKGRRAPREEQERYAGEQEEE